MHNFLEGILPLEMKLIIGELISEDSFTLDELNACIASFNYGPVDVKNKPSCIRLKNSGGSSGQKAAQMMTLAVYLPLIIGDLVDENSEHWKLLLMILDIS